MPWDFPAHAIAMTSVRHGNLASAVHCRARLLSDT